MTVWARIGWREAWCRTVSLRGALGGWKRTKKGIDLFSAGSIHQKKEASPNECLFVSFPNGLSFKPGSNRRPFHYE